MESAVLEVARLKEVKCILNGVANRLLVSPHNREFMKWRQARGHRRRIPTSYWTDTMLRPEAAVIGWNGWTNLELRSVADIRIPKASAEII